MSLRKVIQEAEKRREVLHITDEVSPKYEAACLMRKFDDGPILVFDRVEGYNMKVIANVCGSRGRLAYALGINKMELHSKLYSSINSPTPPDVASSAPSQEVIEEPDLTLLPILTHFEKDKGPYITSGVVYARNPEDQVENVSIHRLQVLDDSTLAIRLVPRHLYRIWMATKEHRENLEVAISLGLHPAVYLAAASSPPYGVNEYHIANSLMDGKLKLTKCLKTECYVPAEAEIVIEGEISFEKEVMEGPFVDILGTYDIERMQPQVSVKAITHRKESLYQAILPSGMEHKLLMGLPREAAIHEAVSRVVPYVKDVVLTSGGGGWLHALISIRKQKEGDGKNALLAAFAAHPSLKHAVVVDDDIDIHDLSAVEWAIATRFQADEDLIVIGKARGSSLDPSSDQERLLTSKLGLDATRPLDKPTEKFERARIPLSSRIKELIEKLKR